MATWGQLVDFVKKNYRVDDQNDRMLRFEFSIGEDGKRSQVVFVSHTPTDDEEWIQIESPIGELDNINLRELLELVENKVVGGVAALNGHAVLRDAIPLADMSVEEFESPFRLVTVTADKLERQLTGIDRY